MPKKNKFPTKYILVVVVIVAVTGIGVVAWHDGLIGSTPLGSINDLTVSSGPMVVHGQITAIVETLIMLNDGTSTVKFAWAGPATLDPFVVVREQVSSAYFLYLVSSVEPVWFFR